MQIVSAQRKIVITCFYDFIRRSLRSYCSTILCGIWFTYSIYDPTIIQFYD